MMAEYPYRYEIAKRCLEGALTDLAILGGDSVGPSSLTWQDMAGLCAANLIALGTLIEQARLGNTEPFPVFPSVAEAVEACGI